MNSYVIIDGSTSANNNPVSQDNRTCEATMARHNTRSSQNTIMRDLDQVVYFTTIANYCRTKLSAVNTGICTYLHSVSNNYIPNLRHLDQTPSIFTWPVSKTVGTNTHIDMKLSLIHISEPTRRTPISYAVFCLKKKK